MNYRTCEAINTNFIVTPAGSVACPAIEELVENSLQRAYIYTNLFFYDITEREINKLANKIAVKRAAIVESSGIPDDDVERLFPSLSAQFKTEVGDNSLDPLIKLELAKTSKHLSLQLTKDEHKQIDAMKHAICEQEIAKFKRAVIFTTDNLGKPYQVNFAEKYINNLPPRCKRIIKPTIKMLAYMDGLQFDQFELDPDLTTLTYTWSAEKPTFDEEKLKDDIKSMIAKSPAPVV